MRKVESYVAVEMNPSTLFAEESVKENLSYRNIVAWRGGKIRLSDKNLVKRFWHGTVGNESAPYDDKMKQLEDDIVKKNEVIQNLSEARDRLVSCLEEKVNCKECCKVPTSAPLYNCPEGHIICSSCYEGPSSECPACGRSMGRVISLIGLTLIQKIKHS